MVTYWFRRLTRGSPAPLSHCPAAGRDPCHGRGSSAELWRGCRRGWRRNPNQTLLGHRISTPSQLKDTGWVLLHSKTWTLFIVVWTYTESPSLHWQPSLMGEGGGGKSRMHTHTHTHTHRYRQCTHTYIHTHTHTHTHTTHTHTHAHTDNAHIHTHTQRTHTHRQHTHVYTHTHTDNAHIHTHTDNAHIHTHKLAHTQIHTQSTHTHKLPSPFCFVSSHNQHMDHFSPLWKRPPTLYCPQMLHEVRTKTQPTTVVLAGQLETTNPLLSTNTPWSKDQDKT